MTLPQTQKSLNGKQKAPPDSSGAFVMASSLEAPATLTRKQQQRTIFPDDVASGGFQSFLYKCYRHEWAGTRLTRWMMLASLAGALLWATVLTPRWLGLVLASFFIVALSIIIVRHRRHDFVRFEEEPMPPVTPAKLLAGDKIPIYATGNFTVEGQYQRFTYLPGFVRTFATGEHAVLCLVRERRFAGVGRWPILEIGMWYAFFLPNDIHGIRYGTLKFAGAPMSAIAIDYRLSIPASSARRDKELNETIYLVCADETDTTRMLADVLYGRASTSATDELLESSR